MSKFENVIYWLVYTEMINETMIPAIHSTLPGFNADVDAELFKRWAIHTKKFRLDEENAITTWKTRLVNIKFQNLFILGVFHFF